MNIYILLYPGFDELDALAPFEVLQRVASQRAGWQVELVTADGAEEVTAANGLRLHPTAGRLDVLARPDLLIVPGGGWVARSPQGVRAEIERRVIPEALAEYHRAGAVLAAVCTGAMLLAAAGLLAGRPAITHHGALDDLRASGAQVVQARVGDDGDIITCGGVTSGLDLALWLAERFAGPAAAVALERGLEYERRGAVWRRSKDEG